MGRTKGGKNREWSKDQKYEIIKYVIDGEKSINDLGREFGISNGMICIWIKRYNEKGIEGLIHISQICERRIAKPEDVLKIGQKVNAKIISIDKENKKIELSIREIEGTSQDTDLMVNEEKSVAVQDEEKGMTTTKETEKSMINTDNNKEIITKD